MPELNYLDRVRICKKIVPDLHSGQGLFVTRRGRYSDSFMYTMVCSILLFKILNFNFILLFGGGVGEGIGSGYRGMKNCVDIFRGSPLNWIIGIISVFIMVFSKVKLQNRNRSGVC